MQAANVRALRDFPLSERDPDEIKRPYRIWSSKNKANVRWKCYKNLRHAHSGCLLECAWSDGDDVLELYSCVTGALYGQYQRDGKTIKFWRSNHSLEDS